MTTNITRNLETLPKTLATILLVALSSCALESAEVEDNASDEEAATEQTITSQCTGAMLRQGAGPNISDPIPPVVPGPGPVYLIPIAHSGSSLCFLAQGDTSPAVVALQHAMRVCYFQAVAIDGDFGPHTKQALINLQRQLGITADGVYGPQTRRRMKFVRNDAQIAQSCWFVTATDADL
jgi:hypothetical protein